MSMMCRFTVIPLLLLLAAADGRAEDGGNKVVAQARAAGVKTCLPAITALSTFLVGDNSHGAHGIWSEADPDGQPFSTTIETNFPDGIDLVSVTAAPDGTGQCSLIYDQVHYFAKSCLALAKENYGTLSYQGTVAKKVAVLSGAATVYLLPAGDGCVALKKEVLLPQP